MSLSILCVLIKLVGIKVLRNKHHRFTIVLKKLGVEGNWHSILLLILLLKRFNVFVCEFLDFLVKQNRSLVGCNKVLIDYIIKALGQVHLPLFLNDTVLFDQNVDQIQTVIPWIDVVVKVKSGPFEPATHICELLLQLFSGQCGVILKVVFFHLKKLSLYLV